MEISRDSFDDRNKQVLVFFSFHPQHHHQRTQAERTHGAWLWRFLIVALSLTIGTGAMPQNPHQSTPCPSASWAWRGPAWSRHGLPDTGYQTPFERRMCVSNTFETNVSLMDMISSFERLNVCQLLIFHESPTLGLGLARCGRKPP